MKRAEREQLWTKWAAMYAEGLNLQQIADAEGVEFHRVYYALRGMGTAMRRGRPRLAQTPQYRPDVFKANAKQVQRIARMEELAYRIAKRRARLYARFAHFSVTHLQPK